MRIMVTNDDGIASIGLHILARALVPLGEVVIVAPDREFSGAGAAVGALHDLRPEARRAEVEGVKEAWTVNGPPALCVMFARLGAFGDPFDLVVSGINPGANVGRAVYHSGTVGAAITARNSGISGVAVSQAVIGLGVEGQGWDEMLEGQLWDTAASVAATYVEGLVANLPADPVLVNINVPNRPLAELRGWRHAEISTKSSRIVASAMLTPKIGQADAYDIKMSWGDGEVASPRADTALVGEGYVTVTNIGKLSPEPRSDLGAAEAALTALVGG